MSDLYDDDILLWSERQAELLRRVAGGEPVNERPDWANIIEEVESVGREQLHAVESLSAAGARAHAEGRRLAASRAMSRTGVAMHVASVPRRGAGSPRPCGRRSTSPASTPTR